MIEIMISLLASDPLILNSVSTHLLKVLGILPSLVSIFLFSNEL